MSGKLGLIELVLTLTLVFGWGFWQLRSLKKLKSDDQSAKSDEDQR